MSKSPQEKGSEFEKIIEKLYNLISENERIDAKVERSVHLIGDDGSDNQFDVIYEYEHFGVNYRVAIECKNWKNPITVSSLRDFEYKLKNVGNLNGIFISAESDFQDGSRKVSAYNGIQLIKYNEFNKFVSGQNEDYLFPDYKTIGDPFWMIMSKEGKNKLEQNLYLGCIYLFESKYFASDFKKILRNNDKYRVVGVSQKHLKEIISLVKHNKLKVKMYNASAKKYDEQNFHFWDLSEEDLMEYMR